MSLLGGRLAASSNTEAARSQSDCEMTQREFINFTVPYNGKRLGAAKRLDGVYFTFYNLHASPSRPHSTKLLLTSRFLKNSYRPINVSLTI